jgi:transcriptional regulator with XRE-family HTH domain
VQKFITDLGVIVREDRAKKKLSQQKYADRAGVSNSLIRDLERGAYANLSLDTLLLLAKELQLPSIQIQFEEPFTEEEAAKHRDILIITNQLYKEDPHIVRLLKNTYPLEIEKLKRIIKDPE